MIFSVIVLFQKQVADTERSFSELCTFSSEAPSSFEAAVIRSAQASASLIASIALTVVKAVTRRIPFAIPSSEISAKALASLVLERCVPMNMETHILFVIFFNTVTLKSFRILLRITD